MGTIPGRNAKPIATPLANPPAPESTGAGERAMTRSNASQRTYPSQTDAPCLSTSTPDFADTGHISTTYR